MDKTIFELEKEFEAKLLSLGCEFAIFEGRYEGDLITYGLHIRVNYSKFFCAEDGLVEILKTLIEQYYGEVKLTINDNETIINDKYKSIVFIFA